MPTVGAIAYRGAEWTPGPEVLVSEHVPLVRRIAWHVHGAMSSAIEIEDLIQAGMVALIEAAAAYEDRGHAFATYAGIRVRGAMIDLLRRQSAQCRSAMAKRREIAGVRTRFEQAVGRSPSDVEMAEGMGLSVLEYHAAAEAAQPVRHESIHDSYSDHAMWFADLSERADEAMERGQLKAAIAAGIRMLAQREAMVLQLYFVEEMNLDEIGATLGVGAARVCQIKKAALRQLRAVMEV